MIPFGARLQTQDQGKEARVQGQPLINGSCFSVKIHKQVWSFVDPYAMQTGFLQLGVQSLPDCNRQILSRGNLREELGDLFVKETVVHGIEHFAVHYFFQLFEVDDKAGTRIDLAFHRDFQSVVVSVAIGVTALAKKAEVLFRGEVRIMVVVRGSEFGFAGEINHCAFLMTRIR